MDKCSSCLLDSEYGWACITFECLYCVNSQDVTLIGMESLFLYIRALWMEKHSLIEKGIIRQTYKYCIDDFIQWDFSVCYISGLLLLKVSPFCWNIVSFPIVFSWNIARFNSFSTYFYKIWHFSTIFIRCV